MAPSSSKTNVNALVPYRGKNGTDLVSEKIDPVILRMLGLEDVFDIDYDTYATLLKEKMAAARMAKKKIPTEEVELVTDEWKRVKGKKGRFKVTKKKITSQSIKKGSATGIKINTTNILTGATGGSQLALPPAKEVADNLTGKNDLTGIQNALNDIIASLTEQNSLSKKQDELNRKNKEKQGRSGLESGLEKRFSFVKKAAEKMVAPVKSLLSKIIDFIVKMLVGRAIMLLFDWFTDKNNQSKIQSIIKFMTDWWPTLLGAFLIFGTGLGGFIANISGILIRGIAALATRNPIVLGTVLGGGLLAGVTKLANNKKDDASKVIPEQPKPEEAPKPQAQTEQPVQKFKGGGLAQLLGGLKEGLSKNKALSGAIGAAAGAALGPLGAILGAVAGSKSGNVAEAVSGLISGQKGVDKIPAMLSDGEFVMSRGAVAKYGVDTLESMNAAGGGTNKPKVVKGKVFAAGGGLVGSADSKNYKRESDGMYSGGLIADRKEELAKKEIDDRLKRIEQQMQVQKALASGKGINIKGAGYGANIGKGFASTFQGRDAIVVKNGVDFKTYSTGIPEGEITLAGKRYFAVKRGQDLIYVSNVARGLKGQVDKYGATNKSYKGSGGGMLGGSNLKKTDKKDLPKTKIMMGPDGPFVGYLRFRNGVPEYARAKQRNKGILEGIADFFDPKGAKKRQETLNARSLRLSGITDLEDMRRRGMTEANIKKMLNERLGATGYARAVNDLKAKQARMKKEAEMDKLATAAAFGTSKDSVGSETKPKVSNLGSDYKRQELKLAAAANKPKKSQPGPPVKPTLYAKPTAKSSSGTNAARSGGGSRSSRGSSVPKFGATCPASKERSRRQKILGIF